MNAHWAACLSFAVLRLGLTPRAFWALSLAEWRALTRPVTGVSDLPDPAALRALAARFPD
ncbi:phage tail assembly chaperone [Glycocaulis abyssi]|uniref:Phage tail assembly chaperone n=1 Tax=Glycocaulis abyssi TaxID=1433403 RepID=A0ABV9N7N3_9PROT